MKKHVLALFVLAIMGATAFADNNRSVQTIFTAQNPNLSSNYRNVYNPMTSSLDEVGTNIDSVTSIALGGQILSGLFRVDDLVYVSATYGGFFIVDVSDQVLPSIAGSNDSLYAYDVFVEGDYAFIAGGDGLFSVLDVSNPSTPVRIGVDTTASNPQDALLSVTVSGSYAYCGSSSGTLRVFSIADPTNPSVVGSLAFSSEYAYNVVVQGDTAYVANGKYSQGSDISALRIVNISNPASPSLINSVTVDLDKMVNRVAMDGSIAYFTYADITSSSGGLKVYDLSDVNNPIQLADYVYANDEMQGINLQGDYAVVGCGWSGIQILDISDAANDNITSAGSIDVSNYCFYSSIDGEYIYTGGLVDFIVLNASNAGLMDDSNGPSSLSITIDQISASTFPEITVNASVVNENGVVVTGLTTSNFTLSEDMVSQSPISLNGNGGAGLIASVIQCQSTSMTQQELADQISGYTNFFHQFADGDSAKIYKFGETSTSYNWVMPDTAQLISDLSHGSDYRGDGHILYDILYYSAWIHDNNGEPGESNISIIVSNGPDTGSDSSMASVISRFQAADAMIYAIGLGEDADEAALQQLASETGGQYFYAATSSELPDLLDNIGASLHSQYEITYTTSNTSEDGTTRTVDLDVNYESLTDTDFGNYTAPSESYTPEIDIYSFGFPNIIIEMSVRDSDMNYITNLTLDDITFTEDGVSQTINSFIGDGIAVYEISYTSTNTATDGASRTVVFNVDDGNGIGTVTNTYTAPTYEDYTVEINSFDTSFFPDVTVNVSVLDESMEAVSGLGLEDFLLVENTTTQTLNSVDEQLDMSYNLVYTTPDSEEYGSLQDVIVYVDAIGGGGSDNDTYVTPLALPVLTISDEDGVIGMGVDVPVTVENFSNISVLELYVDFDTTKATYSGMVSDYLVDPVFNAVGGTFILSWYSVDPLELMDDDTLFTVQFDLLADGLVHDESTPLTWSEESYIADFDAVVIEGVGYIPGSITGIGYADISGMLAYYSSEIPLGGATVNLTGDTDISVTSDEWGIFLFEDILPGNYVVSAELDDEGHPGVNTLDAFRIQLSLDGLNPFTSGYETFASDVDLSEGVNTLDAFKIQRVVVGLDEGFDGGDWGFISSSYEMTLDNWATAEQNRLVSLMGVDAVDQDFFGVRIGDANGTWPSNFLDPPEFDLDELTGSMMLSEAVVGPGGIATVQLRAQDLMELGVIEWHIEFDPTVVTLQDFDLPELGRAMTSVTDSTFSVSWFNISSPMDCDNRVLGTFEFQAVDEDYVYSDLNLNNVVLGDAQGQQLWTEVIDGSVTVNSEAAANYNGDIITEWALHPVYPNPFNAYTTLSFDVKETGKVQVNVYNILGDLVTTLVNGNLPMGRYTSTVDAKAWASGTYFIVMKTNNFNKIQKMVLLK